nr:type II toxin-antitoxin system PemK/MazF family toxin [Patulibacter sp.]
AARVGRGVITVVPVTSNVSRVYPFQVLLPSDASGLPVDSKAQAEQVRTIAVERIGPAIGRLPSDLGRDLDAALRLHLGL